MKLSYRNNLKDYINHHRLQHPDGFKKWRDQVIISLCYPLILGAAAIGFSWQPAMFLSCIIIAGLGWYTWSCIPLRSRYEDHLKSAFSHIEEREIELEVEEKGFTERVAGIESFCPWSSTLGYYDYENTIFVELKNTLWAIIPKDALDSSSDDISGFIAILENNGIKKVQNKSVEATA